MFAPWLVWLSGWMRPVNQKVTVQFCVRTHAWASGHVPGSGWGPVRGNRLMCLSHIDFSFSFSLPSPLSENK